MVLVGDTREPDDDLYEPFELEEIPPPQGRRRTEPGAGYYYDDEAAYEEPLVSTIACPSCGTPNPATARHCEECGARIAQGPLPVAPQPLVRTTAGGRALLVMAAVVALVAIGALIYRVISGGSDTAAATTTLPSETTSPTAVEPGPVAVASVTATSELTNFPATNLIDGNTATEWQVSNGGTGASLTFTFAQPVELQAIQVQNIVDPARFVRNFRVQGYRLKFNDVTPVDTGDLADTLDPQSIAVSTIATTRVTLDVTSTYPATGDADNPPFNELGLAEITFIGRIAPAAQ